MSDPSSLCDCKIRSEITQDEINVQGLVIINQQGPEQTKFLQLDLLTTCTRAHAADCSCSSRRQLMGTHRASTAALMRDSASSREVTRLPLT